MNRIPVMDPPVGGPSPLLAVSHRFDLLRADLMDKQAYVKTLEAELEAARTERNVAQNSMSDYLREQGVL